MFNEMLSKIRTAASTVTPSMLAFLLLICFVVGFLAVANAEEATAKTPMQAIQINPPAVITKYLPNGRSITLCTELPVFIVGPILVFTTTEGSLAAMSGDFGTVHVPTCEKPKLPENDQTVIKAVKP